jgi:hypothetical protein
MMALMKYKGSMRRGHYVAGDGSTQLDVEYGKTYEIPQHLVKGNLASKDWVLVEEKKDEHKESTDIHNTIQR